MTYSIVDDGTTHALPDAAIEMSEPGRPSIREDALRSALGWELKPEGLCQGDVCVPVRDRAALVRSGAVDLTGFAALMGRPIIVDADERVTALGRAVTAQAASMATLEAPDFELPDLAGNAHRLSDHRGKKVLFIAYASW